MKSFKRNYSEVRELTQWKKKEFKELSVDFNELEEYLEDLIFEAFEPSQMNPEEPIQLGFTISLRPNGRIKIDEFGILNEKNNSLKEKTEEPLVELINNENEITIVVETNNINARLVDVKILDQTVIISSNKKNGFMKKIILPEKVKTESVKTTQNNNIIEIKILKIKK